MKKIITFISIVVIFIGSILLYDRHMNIDYEDGFYEGHISIIGGTFFDQPKGKWLDLSDEMEVYITDLFVDEYNHFLCTWENTYNMYTSWHYVVDENDPMTYLLFVIEKDIYDRRTFANPVEYIHTYGEVEGLKISYDYLNDHIYVKIESKTKTIELDIYKEHKDILESVVLKAIDVLKD